jgi:hypothetical protein
VVPLLLGLLAALVAYGRWHVVPILATRVASGGLISRSG